MKKINHKSKPPTEKKSEPVEVKPVDHYLQNLELEKRQTSRRPTVFELAQITAVLIPSDGWKEYLGDPDEGPIATSAEECAMDLWDNCGHRIRERIDREIFSYNLEGFPEDPKWKIALRQETFPMPFEKALKIIVCKTPRKSDRYLTLRKLLKSVLAKKNETEPNIGSLVNDYFDKLKVEGFSEIQFEYLASRIDSWKAKQKTENAKKAAASRWKNNTKK